MADVVITIQASVVSYQSWLRTSYIGMALNKEGIPLVQTTELGPDQEDAFNNFFEESAREVLKVFLSRQGDADGVPFEFTALTVIYRFKEETPTLNQATAIKDALGEDVKNALFSYVTLLWFKTKLNEAQVLLLQQRYSKLTDNIDHHLYKLHD